METTAKEVRVSARGTPLHEPSQDGLSTRDEILSLAADLVAFAEVVDCKSEQDRLLRAAAALESAAGAEVHDVGRGDWARLGDIAASVVKRLSHE
jgi:hypothetical protein